jgi:tRNA(fMet)-specific endonuclease VapC
MNGRVLLDTNIVIATLRAEPGVQRRLGRCERVFLSSIVLGELYFGAYNSERVSENLANIENVAPQMAVVSCDKNTAQIYGRIRSLLRRKGRPMGDHDIWIAATALQHDLTLVSRDLLFLEVEGLALEVW